MCIELVTFEILPPPSLTATDGGLVRRMLRILNNSRYRSYADKSAYKGALYESAVSQRVSRHIVAEKFTVRKRSNSLHWAGIPLGRHPAGPASRLLIIPTWATSMGQLWMENVMSFVNQLLCYDRSGNIY